MFEQLTAGQRSDVLRGKTVDLGFLPAGTWSTRMLGNTVILVSPDNPPMWLVDGRLEAIDLTAPNAPKFER